MKRIAIVFLWLGTFLSSVLLTPELPYVGTKVVLADLFLVLAIATMFLQVLDDRGFAWQLVRPQRAVLLLISLMLVASLVAYAYISIPRGTAAGEGLIAITNYLYGFLLMIACIYWLRTIDDLERIVTAVLLGGLLVSTVAAVALATGIPAWAFSGYRISSTMNATNQVQSYVAPAMCFATTYVVSGRSPLLLKAFAIVLLLLGSAALIATGSRSSAVFLLLILLFFAMRVVLSSGTPVWLKSLSFIGSFGAGLGLLTFASFVATYGAAALPQGPMRVAARPVVEFVRMQQQDEVLEAMGPRGAQIALVEQNWYKSPVFGFGPGAFEERFNHHFEVHNTYLGLLIEHGTFGLFCILGVLGVVAYTLLKRVMKEPDWERRQFLIGLLAALAMIYFYGLFTFGLRQRVFWLVLGLAAAALRLTGQNRRDPSVRRPQYLEGAS